MSDTAKLNCGDAEVELPVVVGTENETAIDISRLRGSTGLITLDEGFVNTGATSSSITYLDGEKVSFDIGVIRSKNWRPSAIL